MKCNTLVFSWPVTNHWKYVRVIKSTKERRTGKVLLYKDMRDFLENS